MTGLDAPVALGFANLVLEGVYGLRFLPGITAHGENSIQKQIVWWDLQPHRRPTWEQPVPEGLRPMEITHTGAVLELQLVGRTCSGEVREGLYPMGVIPRRGVE